MKNIFYKEQTTALLQFLKYHLPKQIFSNQQDQVVFNYKDFHIIALLGFFIPASQNKSDEIIRAKFERIDSVFQPSKNDQLMFENKKVDRVWILRTMLYFTDHTFFKSEAEALNFQSQTETEPVLADLISNSTGGHEEVICHPQSIEAKRVNQKFANLIDTGIMLEIDQQLLMCFGWNNGYCIVGYVMSPDYIKEEIAPDYEFIQI